MSEKLSLVKIKDVFRPAAKSDMELMNKFSDGEIILVSMKKSRNPNHHRLIFALGRLIKDNLPEDHFLENQLPYDIIKAIMLDAGIVDYKMNLNGTTRIEPKSISFENMSEDEFQPVSEAIFKIAAKLLGVEVDELHKNYLVYL